MTLTRAFSRLICRVLIGMTLLTQLAIASYACPGLMAPDGPARHPAAMNATPDHLVTPSDGRRDQSADPASGRMAACDEMGGAMDQDAPHLCAEHCHHGQQSDFVQVPGVPAIVLTSLYIVEPTVPGAFAPISAIAASVDVPIAAATPHAILHCVFRI